MTFSSAFQLWFSCANETHALWSFFIFVHTRVSNNNRRKSRRHLTTTKNILKAENICCFLWPAMKEWRKQIFFPYTQHTNEIVYDLMKNIFLCDFKLFFFWNRQPSAIWSFHGNFLSSYIYDSFLSGRIVFTK